MKTEKRKHRVLAGIFAFALALILGVGVPAFPAYAASGNVYTNSITPCYRHPVTGTIEDSGGEASYATGQGMVEGAVYNTGIMEVTSDGSYYLTIRMSLMDYTSNHSLWVQNVGDSGWSTPAELGVTGNGTDSNGTTADICMKVPSENCVVRVGMYVESMGRDVIFYVYPSNYSAGNSTDMKATIVTATAESGTSVDNNTSTDSNTLGNSGSTGSGNTTSGGSTLSGNSSLSGNTNDTTKDTETSEAPKLESSITNAATEDESINTDDTTLNGAQGLSLSTAENAEDTEDVKEASSGSSAFQIALAIVISGLVLIGVAAGVVYYFRRNWKRWGGAQDDEE